MSNAKVRTRKSKTPHLVIEEQPDSRRVVFLCKHCGERFTFLLPTCSIMIGACTNGFKRAHRDCRPRESEF